MAKAWSEMTHLEREAYNAGFAAASAGASLPRPEGSSDTKRLDWVLGLTPLLICKGRKVEPNRKAIDAELRAPQEQIISTTKGN